MAVSVNIKGFKEVEKALKEFGKEGQAVALDVVFATAPQPYLYPAFQKGSRMLFKDLRNELKRLTDKFNG